MPWQCHTSQRKQRKESSRATEKGQEFRIVHLPDRPLKRISYRDIPKETDCKRIFLDWKTGKVKPPRVRSRRLSRNIERRWDEESVRMNGMCLGLERGEYQESCENQSYNLGIQKGPSRAALIPSSSQMATHGITHRKLQESQHASQQIIQPRTTYNPQPSLKTTHSLLPDESLPSTQSSTLSPQSPAIPLFACPLCRSPSKDNQGGLCNTCKAEFAMSSSVFCEDDESSLYSSACFLPVEHLATVARYSYSSSVYSLGRNSIENSRFSVSPVSLGDGDDPILPVSPCSSIGDACAPAPDTRISACCPNQYGRDADLYDLDWAEYYFDEKNFAPPKNGRERM